MLTYSTNYPVLSRDRRRKLNLWKEKEQTHPEYHLQQAITAQQASTLGTLKSPADAVIPIPKVEIDPIGYESLYHNNYKPPKQLIRVQATLSLEPEHPDYDLDSEDERSIDKINEKHNLDITPLQFERIMDVLEKQSEYKVVSVEHAKLLLQEEDDDVVFAVYDYWLTRRLKVTALGRQLMPKVRVERREATTLVSDPYVGFRRRAEKMQTRKNRKNDEESYEKILKLRNDLQKALTLLEMVKRREKSKRELIKLGLELSEKRQDMKDFGCEIYNQLKQVVKPAFQFSKEELLIGRSRRQSSRRRRVREDRELVSREWLLENAEEWHKPALFPSTSLTSPLRQIRSPTALSTAANDLSDANLPGSLLAAEKDLADPAVDGPYAMKRRRGCVYLAPVVDENFLRFSDITGKNGRPTARRCWPWQERRPIYGYSPGCLNRRWISKIDADDELLTPDGLVFIGLVRRRMGRGGRVLMDRLNYAHDFRFETHGEHRYYEPLDQKASTSNLQDRNDALRSVVSKTIPYYYPSNRMLDLIDDSTSTANNRLNVASPSSRPLTTSLLNIPDSMLSPSSLNEQQNRPCAILSGPRGRVHLQLKLGISPDLYEATARTLNPMTPFRKPTSSPPTHVASAPPPLILTLDSRRAFEAAAAVMTAEQMLRLAQRYRRHSPPTSRDDFISVLKKRDDCVTSLLPAVDGSTASGAVDLLRSVTSVVDGDELNDRLPPTDPTTPMLPSTFNGVDTILDNLDERRKRRRRSPPPDPTPDGLHDKAAKRRKLARASIKV